MNNIYPFRLRLQSLYPNIRPRNSSRLVTILKNFGRIEDLVNITIQFLDWVCYGKHENTEDLYQIIIHQKTIKPVLSHFEKEPQDNGGKG